MRRPTERELRQLRAVLKWHRRIGDGFVRVGRWSTEEAARRLREVVRAEEAAIGLGEDEQ